MKKGKPKLLRTTTTSYSIPFNSSPLFRKVRRSYENERARVLATSRASGDGSEEEEKRKMRKGGQKRRTGKRKKMKKNKRQRSRYRFAADCLEVSARV